MWTWSLNWGEVTPEIVIGSCPMTPDDLKTIAHSARVSAVLSLQHNDCLAWWGIDDAQMRSAGSGQGLVMVRCSIRDFDVADMRRYLPRSCRAGGAQGTRAPHLCSLHGGSGTQSFNGTGLSCPGRGLFTRAGHSFDPRGTSRGSARLGSFPRLSRGSGQPSSRRDREACLRTVRAGHSSGCRR